MTQDRIKAYVLETDKDLDIIQLPYNSAATLLRYEEPEQYCEYLDGEWRCDVYYKTRSNGEIVLLVAGTLPFGNHKPSQQLIAKYESKAIQVNSRLTAYWEKKNCTQEILQDFIDEVFIEEQRVLNYNQRMTRLKEEHDQKQREIENWENNH